jgi:predicted oxidoreductase
MLSPWPKVWGQGIIARKNLNTVPYGHIYWLFDPTYLTIWSRELSKTQINELKGYQHQRRVTMMANNAKRKYWKYWRRHSADKKLKATHRTVKLRFT